MIFAVLSCLSRGPACAQTAKPVDESRPVALVGGTLIDGTGAKPIFNTVVLIRRQRIEKIGPIGSLTIPPEYERISTEGMTMLPGLWDMHTHLQYSAHVDLNHWNTTYFSQMERVIMPAIASQLLLAGVTSARDTMAPTDQILAVRERIANGQIPGPTLYVSGALLEHQPPAGTEAFRWGVSGTADAKTKVDQLADKGVNLIKLLCVPEMTVEEARAVVDEAHLRGLKVAAHGRTDDEVRKCLTAGVDDFQHLSPQAIFPNDIVNAIRQRTASRTLYWTPTVGSPILYKRFNDTGNFEILDDPAWQRGLTSAMVDDVRQSLPQLKSFLNQPGGFRDQIVVKDLAVYRKKFDQLRELRVELLVGTDSGNPGYFHPQALWQELDDWVTYMGVDPLEAIRRDTFLAAQVMGVDKDYGSVAVGKYADLIVVHGDPLQHMNILRDPVIVIKHGHRYK